MQMPGQNAYRGFAISVSASWTDRRFDSHPRTSPFAMRLLKDVLGELELAAGGDPSFESVSRHFPPLKWPREVVGVLHAAHKIGVDADGSLELKLDRWNARQPVGFFEIGDPAQRFGSGEMSCAKRLHQGFLPVVIVNWTHDGLTVEETVFGHAQGMAADAAQYAYARLRVTNDGAVAPRCP